MKVVLFYGPGESQKRAEAMHLKEQFKAECVSIVDLKNSNVVNLADLIAQTSLFETDPKLIVVENVPENFDLEKININTSEGTLLLLGQNLKDNSALVTKTHSLQGLIKRFEGEKELQAFAYLDCLLEGQQNAFVELAKLLSEYDGVYLISMIYYLLRRNLLPLPSSNFLRQKITRQKQALTEGDWLKLYQLTLEAEYKIKSGQFPDNPALFTLTEAFLQLTKR
ncbi:hypothetical protein M1563_01995 [Patescibacteria group bacterium]|nr:hypothetical protein [Patescibacteria group bacterium]